VHVQLLIDSIVRQTTVLIAQLATAGGVRAPLAHVAGQVFVELSRALREQGISRKVRADMFGMALRSYQRKTQRLEESFTDRGKSLWEAVFSYLGQRAVTTRAQVRERFRNDDQEQVKSVLHDLTESGLVYASGTGASSVYRVVGSEELGQIAHLRKDAEIDTLLWALIFREGPIAREQLEERCAQPPEALDAAIARLLAQGRVRCAERSSGVVYSAPELVVGFDEPAGWEAAVWDHYQAVVQTITTKLAHETAASQRDLVGGSTYTFVVWPGHPLEEEVLSQLREYRAQQSALRARVDAYNAAHPMPAERTEVVVYGGQCVRSVGDELAAGRGGQDDREEKADA
jgi:hypothetical protein